MNNEYVPVTRRDSRNRWMKLARKFAATHDMNVNKEIERLASEYVEP